MPPQAPEDSPQVVFQEETQYAHVASAEKQSLFLRLAYMTGIPKTDAQAQYMLLGAAVVVGVAALAVPFFFVTGGTTPPQSVVDSAMKAPRLR